MPRATCAGKPISGCPFLCHVSAGEVDASNSRLFGPGLQAVQLGRESQLFCELADAFGNKVESAAASGADLKVRLQLHTEQSSDSAAGGGGIYRGSLTKLSVMLKSICAAMQVLVKGPAPTTVTPGATRDGLHAFSYCARSTGRHMACRALSAHMHSEILHAL